MPNVVFCTTVKNRTQHLRRTLPQNLEDNPKSKFIVLDYNTEDELLDYLFAEHRAEIASGKLIVYSNLIEPKFRMAHAKNMVHRLGIAEGADILVNQDADNLTGLKFENYIVDQFEKNPNAFLWANVTHGIHLKSGAPVVRGLSGRIVVSRQAFYKTGGYDEKFNEWSPDDKDFNLRLRIAGYDGVEIHASYLLGIPHNEKIRFKEYPHLQEATEEYFDSVNRHTVTQATANMGNFGCGIVYKNGDFLSPISLNVVPTQRVFGIGMHKTGTTSLSRALETLGYSSWHWSSAHVAKAIWQQMNNIGHSALLEGYHSATDIPIPMLYRQLDKAYPNSKFILTLREDTQWLSSVKKHFSYDGNKWRGAWDGDPFSHLIHKVIYGRTEFDPEVFLARYQRHNAEVLDYFKHRPKDLLVLPVGNGTGWPKLCEFLQMPIPNMPYPHENVSRS